MKFNNLLNPSVRFRTFNFSILLLIFCHNTFACGSYYVNKDGVRIDPASIPIVYSAEKTKQIINKAKMIYHEKTKKNLPDRIINDLVAIQKLGSEFETIDDAQLNKFLDLLIRNMIADKTNYFVKLAELVNFDFYITIYWFRYYDEIHPPDEFGSDIFKSANKHFLLDLAKEHKRMTSGHLEEISY